jgi:hypothetical protein
LDIKPDNILLLSNDYTNAKSSMMGLVDFSVSKRFTNDAGSHIPEKKMETFEGNLAFSSKYQLMELSKKLISIFYF